MTVCLANAIYLSGLACFNVIYLWYTIFFGCCQEFGIIPKSFSIWNLLIENDQHIRMSLQRNRTFSFISYFAVSYTNNVCMWMFLAKTNWIISISFFCATQFITIRVLLSLNVAKQFANTVSAIFPFSPYPVSLMKFWAHQKKCWIKFHFEKWDFRDLPLSNKRSPAAAVRFKCQAIKDNQIWTNVQKYKVINWSGGHV